MRTLREVFQLDRLRPAQEAVIRLVLSGRDTLAIMPTGAGKSLCYQLPGMLLPGMTVVVSPLIALMKDQHDKLTRLGVPVAQINSALAAAEAGASRRAIAGRRSAFTFVTPEQLATSTFYDVVGRQPIDLLVVDEAHCVSRWGHDFRPSYLELAPAIAKLGRPPVLALTATAPPQVIEDITTALQLDRPVVLNTGLFRSNLRLAVRPVTGDTDKLRHVVEIVRRHAGPGIVYAATIPHVEAIHRVLVTEGCTAAPYHGRLPARVRTQNQERFMNGEVQTVVATNAFGLGIDKADIRFVVHADLPGSLEAYYQEAGRAGRDGQESDAVLLFQRSDRSTQSFLMAGRYPKADHIAAVVHALRGSAATPGRLSFADLQSHLPRVPRRTLRVIVAGLRAAGLATDTRSRGLRLTEGATDEAVTGLTESYGRRVERDRDMLDRMIAYGQTARCRWKVILDYFGEVETWERCGTCDTCEGSALRANGDATR